MDTIEHMALKFGTHIKCTWRMNPTDFGDPQWHFLYFHHEVASMVPIRYNIPMSLYITHTYTHTFTHTYFFINIIIARVMVMGIIMFVYNVLHDCYYNIIIVVIVNIIIVFL